MTIKPGVVLSLVLFCGGCDSSLPGDATDGGADMTPACSGAGAACTTNENAGCSAGITVCEGSQPRCIDALPVADGTACAGGFCTHGTCLGTFTISESVDLSALSITAGRACAAEAPSASVTALTATTATVTPVPSSDCLVSGDEVVLINLQGTAADSASVGNWELLDVKTVDGATVTFKTAKTRTYGTGGGDSGIGTGATDQKVALVRVPHFGNLAIGGGVKVTTAPWNGTLGGVLALRAAKLKIDGTLSVLGYRSGRWSQDGQCTSSVTTEAGESIGGPPIAQTQNQQGGAGGIGAGGAVYISNTPVCSGAGHSSVGDVGGNGQDRTVGAPGAAYGIGDGTRLTMGSGGCGNITCDGSQHAPLLVPLPSSNFAGGVIAVFADQLEVTASGSITASAIHESHDVSASGGYVLLRGSTINVGDRRVTAIGGISLSENGPAIGEMAKSSDGYIVVQAKNITGTTSPKAQ